MNTVSVLFDRPVKHRDMLTQVFLIIITFGIYYFYWFYQTSMEMKSITKDQDASPTLWTILLIIPFGSLYSFYCYSKLYEKIAYEKINKWIIYILWFCFSPAVWFLVQRDLNRMSVKSN